MLFKAVLKLTKFWPKITVFTAIIDPIPIGAKKLQKGFQNPCIYVLRFLVNTF